MKPGLPQQQLAESLVSLNFNRNNFTVCVDKFVHGRLWVTHSKGVSLAVDVGYSRRPSLDPNPAVFRAHVAPGGTKIEVSRELLAHLLIQDPQVPVVAFSRASR